MRAKVYQIHNKRQADFARFSVDYRFRKIGGRAMSDDQPDGNGGETERLRARVAELEARCAAMSQAERFLDSIIDNIPTMVFVKDAAELRFVRLNKAEVEMINLPIDQLLGKNDHDLFPQDEADFFNDMDRKVLESGELLDIPEEPIQTNKGMLILHTKKIPLLDDNGRPQY